VTRRVVFTPLAQAEFADAVDWYEARSLRTRDRFIAGIENLRNRIADNPLQYERLRGDARRAFLHGFPYMLIYRPAGDVVQVLGCFHTSRNPRGWRRRLSS
jgi:plasmid stabilization system protein ParE